jgi:hypothetical protein
MQITGPISDFSRFHRFPAVGSMTCLDLDLPLPGLPSLEILVVLGISSPTDN